VLRVPRRQVDITEGIQKQCTVLWCKECNRWLNVRAAAARTQPHSRSRSRAPRRTPPQPPKNWMRAELESKELLTFCVKKVKGLGKVKLVDAGFIWTEPHSRRLKLKLTVQAEVLNGAILQQTFVVEVRARARCARGAAFGLRERARAWAAAASDACGVRCADAPGPQFVVEPHMCEQCQRSNTNSEVWLACVQARARTALPPTCQP
jgi:nonsense-mediated mRNA decay protein 3